MKKLMLFLVALVMLTVPVFSLAQTEGKVWKIGVTTQSWEFEFIKNMVRALEAIDEEMDNVELILYDSQDSIEKQLGDVDSMIVAEVDGILLNALSFEGTSSAVEAAKAAGIPLVEFISYTENTDYATFVGTDVKSSGVMAGKFVAEVLNGKGNVFELQGQIGHTAQINRGAGIAEALAEYPDIKIVASQSGEFSKDKAMGVTEAWLLQYGVGEIDAIVAHNDQMALGAMNACIAAGRSEIKIVGIDGDYEALTAIQEGTMTATMVDYAEYECELAVQEMVSILKGNEPKGKIIAEYVLVSTPEDAQVWLEKRSQ
jgi:inositol transport system substrate-binding protein